LLLVTVLPDHFINILVDENFWLLLGQAYSFIADFIPGEQFAAILFSQKLKQRGVTWQIH